MTKDQFMEEVSWMASRDPAVIKYQPADYVEHDNRLAALMAEHLEVTRKIVRHCLHRLEQGE